MLREPVKRVLSYYAWMQDNREIVVSPYGDMPLEKWLRSDYIGEHVHDMQTRLLGRRTGEDVAVTPAVFEQAKQNLEEHFTVAGVIERFDESMMMMRRNLEWPKWPFYERRNVTATPVRPEDVRPELLALIVDRNRFDTMLFRWVTERFDAQVRAAGLRFSSEVTLFRWLNNSRGRRARRSVRRMQRAPSKLKRILTHQ